MFRISRSKQKVLLIGTILIAFPLIAFAAYSFIPSWLSLHIGKDKSSEVFDKEHPVKLKVVYPDEGLFMDHFGKAFVLRYPNVSFEVITAAPGRDRLSILEPGEAKERLERNHPDVLLLNPQAYARLASEGQLVQLDNGIKQDRFDLNSFDSRIVASLRQLSEGKLYGLSPEVERMGLFYNRELFETYGVPLPAGRMSWTEVLQLAARFPAGIAEKRIYGLSVASPSTPGQLIKHMGETNGLKLFDATNRTLTMQTESWQAIWNEALDGFRRGYVLWENPPGKNLFLAGQVAMTLQPFSFISTMNAAVANKSWDVVTEPVNPSAPDVSSTFNIPMIYAINAKSSSMEAAWELLKFINSKEIAAKLLRERQDIPLLARKQQLLDYVKSMGMTTSVDVFYELEPGTLDSDVYGKGVPGFNRLLLEAMDANASAVLKGNKTVSEALQGAEQRAMEALIKSADQ